MVTICNPCQRLLQIILPDGIALDIAVGHLSCHAVASGEEYLCIREPCPGISRIEQFLGRQDFSGDIDDLEPF